MCFSVSKEGALKTLGWRVKPRNAGLSFGADGFVNQEVISAERFSAHTAAKGGGARRGENFSFHCKDSIPVSRATNIFENL